MRQQPLQRLTDKCGVISRHITTRVLSPLFWQWRICALLPIVISLLLFAYSVASSLLPNFFEQLAIDTGANVHHRLRLADCDAQFRLLASCCYQKLVQCLCLVLLQQLPVLFQYVVGNLLCLYKV